jgi:nucleoside-diphosphate-sugar epimerase
MGSLSNPKDLHRILVTGGGGFLGQAIVRRLIQKGYVVRSFNRRKYPDLEKDHIEQVQGDISDPDAVDAACGGVDLVFHVAAKIGDWGKYEAYFNANVKGTRNIVTSCLKQGVGFLVYTSTPSVSYNKTEVTGADESLPYPQKYLTHYQKTKSLAEQHVIQASSSSLKTIILRPRNIWGPGDNQLVPGIIERANQLFRIGDGKNLVDTVYIDNAADAHILAAEKLLANPTLSGNVYFISQDEPVYCWDIINKILHAAGKPPVKRSMPAGIAYALGAMLELIYKILHLRKGPKMNRFLALELSQSHWFDISAAKRDLGYIPRVTIEEGLGHLREWLASERRDG